MKKIVGREGENIKLRIEKRKIKGLWQDLFLKNNSKFHLPTLDDTDK